MESGVDISKGTLSNILIEGKEGFHNVKDQIRQLYGRLKAYKKKPTPKDKQRLENLFDEIFTQKTLIQ